MKNKEFIPALRYHFLTPVYDSVIKILVPERQVKLKTLQLANLKSGEQLLDFGCGTGTLLQLLAAGNSEVNACGIDIDEKMLSVAKNKLAASLSQIKLIQYTGHQLPLSKQSFDKIVSTWVFHHFTDEQKTAAFEQLFNVLKPGGKLIITDWGKAANWPMRLLFFGVQLVDNFKTTAPNVQGRLPQFIKNAGFENVQIVANQSTALGTLSYYTAYKPA